MSKYEIRTVKLDSMQVHPRVQRERRPHWVARLVEEYDPLGIGVFTAFEVDGKLLIIDGAHRYTMLKELELDDLEVPVLVYMGLSLEEQVHVFKLLNNTLKVDPYSLYSLGMLEGNDLDLKVTELVENYGWKIAEKRGPKTISGISTLKSMFDRDLDATKFAFNKVTELYGSDIDAADIRLLYGFWWFYKRHGDVVSSQRAKRRILSAYPTAGELLKRSYNYKQHNRSHAQAVSEAIRVAID